MFPRSDKGSDAERDLIGRLQGAQRCIRAFGLTRNFYLDARVRPIIENKALSIPIDIYVMKPRCAARRDRYRIERKGAEYPWSAWYDKHIFKPLVTMAERINDNRKTVRAGLNIYTFNFPIGFAIEQIDDRCRVMLYGHGKRGTDSPMFVFSKDTPYYQYFVDQLTWLKSQVVKPDDPKIEVSLVAGRHCQDE